MQFLKAAAVSLLGFISTESAASEAVRRRNEPAMQNQTEAVATLRDPLHRWDLNMAHSHQTASPFFFPPFAAVSLACLCQFPDMQAQGIFLARTGQSLFANEPVVVNECGIRLSALEERPGRLVY